MKHNTVVASFVSRDNVYLLCDDLAQEIRVWTSPQAAVKWFKKYFSAIWRTRGDVAAKKQYDHFEFRLHRLGDKEIENDSFEQEVVKAPHLLSEKLTPQDHIREPIGGPALPTVGLLCQGDRAKEWHVSGGLAPFANRP